MKTFGERLMHARTAKGLTQKGLGDLIGLDASHISNAEAGKRNLSRVALIALEAKVGVSRKWLESGEGEPFARKENEIRLTSTARGDVVNQILLSVIPILESRVGAALAQRAVPALRDRLARDLEAAPVEDAAKTAQEYADMLLLSMDIVKEAPGPWNDPRKRLDGAWEHLSGEDRARVADLAVRLAEAPSGGST